MISIFQKTTASRTSRFRFYNFFFSIFSNVYRQVGISLIVQSSQLAVTSLIISARCRVWEADFTDVLLWWCYIDYTYIITYLKRIYLFIITFFFFEYVISFFFFSPRLCYDIDRFADSFEFDFVRVNGHIIFVFPTRIRIPILSNFFFFFFGFKSRQIFYYFILRVESANEIETCFYRVVPPEIPKCYAVIFF